MVELSHDDFDQFFYELWGKRAFQWQRDLAQRVLTLNRAPWPEAIALPTAAGKTACLDVAVFSLAAQAGRIGGDVPVSAPRRIFFVVDRRVIVDEAFERALTMAKKLRDAEGGILKSVADNLRRIALGEVDGFEQASPLEVHILRGGMYRSEGWAHDPLQPSIIASTVDQLGSRLLFRAYGRRNGMWPVYAGLAGNDSLVLLDEAHCAQPFFQTLQAVKRYREWGESPLGRCFHPVVMSATPPEGLEKFEDCSGEPADPGHPLGKRQLAHKPATLQQIGAAKGANATASFAKALFEAGEALVSEGRKAVVIFVNRVATARATYQLFLDKYGEDAILLTGRMRPIDKDEIVSERLKPLSSSQSDARHFDTPRFVVATQTLEVGADLDFDALVTECASLDALRQRFGRLNRMGRTIAARATILLRGDQPQDDPVYGPALINTWAWLEAQQDERGEVDFGVASLAQRLPERSVLASLNAPAVDAPVMLPAHVDCWVQTEPAPAPSPDVSLFLHGPRKGAADVQVCWRADLDLDTSEGIAYALESLSLCPPSSAESMPVPIGVFKRWMAGRTALDDATDADVEGAGSAEESEEEGEQRVRRVIRWHGRETIGEDVTSIPARIRPGDVVVVPTSCDGWHELGELPSAVPEHPASLDLGDRAHRTARAKALIRIHPALVHEWPDELANAKQLARNLLDFGPEQDPNEITEAIKDLLIELEASGDSLPKGWKWLSDSAMVLYDETRGLGARRAIKRIGQAYFIIGSRVVPQKQKRFGYADLFSDEDDTSASGVARRNGAPVKLLDHLPGVAGFARRFAKGCGLPPRLVSAIETAGLLHDLGKADPRFQALLRGGNRWAVADTLAKSGDMPVGLQAARAAREAAGYPENARHELLSVRLAEHEPALLPEDNEAKELVLHLIASHHGHCRPFAPVVRDDLGADVEFEFGGHRLRWQGQTRMEHLDSGVPERFWNLVRCYGWWGLAWLEALVRLADHRRSEWEETHDEPN